MAVLILCYEVYQIARSGADPSAAPAHDEPLAEWRRRLDDELLSNTVFGAVNRVLAHVPRAVLVR